MIEDEQLLKQIAERYKPAFKELFQRYAPVLLRMARRLAGRRFDAEEAVQEIMLRIWSRAGYFDPAKGKAKSWILKLAANVTINLTSSKIGKSAGREISDGGETAERSCSLQPDPEICVQEKYENEHVLAVLETLPDDLRQAVILRHIEGLGIEEIAEVMDCPPGTVKSRIFNGLRKLRELLGKEVVDERQIAVQ